MVKIDLKFIEKLKEWDEGALNCVRSLCVKNIFPYVNDQGIAEQIAETAFDKIVDAIPTYDPEKGRGTVSSNFMKWLKTITYNTFLDIRAEDARKLSFEALANSMGFDDSDGELIAAEFESLEQLIRSSVKAYGRNDFANDPQMYTAVREVVGVFHKVEKSRERIALILKYIYGLKTEEIADVMGENFDAIQTAIYRSRDDLRNLFTEIGIDSNYLAPESWRIKHITH
mgnify:CR=1 FL=1